MSRPGSILAPILSFSFFAGFILCIRGELHAVLSGSLSPNFLSRTFLLPCFFLSVIFALFALWISIGAFRDGQKFAGLFNLSAILVLASDAILAYTYLSNKGLI